MRIGISGKMGSGKTSVSQYLVDQHGFERMSFATPLKELEKIHAAFPPGEWYNKVWDIASGLAMSVGSPDRTWEIAKAIVEGFHLFKPTSGIKNRALLQYIGTEVVRDRFGDATWAKYLVNNIKSPNVVVDDVRFISEAEELLSAGFTLVRLEISPNTQIKRLSSLHGEIDSAKLKHRSEIELDNYDKFYRVINNDSNWEGTIRNIEQLLKKKTEVSI